MADVNVVEKQKRVRCSDEQFLEAVFSSKTYAEIASKTGQKVGLHNESGRGRGIGGWSFFVPPKAKTTRPEGGGRCAKPRGFCGARATIFFP